MEANRGRVVGTLTSAVAAFALLALFTGTAQALTITTSTGFDEYGNNASACSLREAIKAAESNAPFGGCTAGASGSDTISLAPGLYTITRQPDPEPPAGTPDDNQDGDFDIVSGHVVTIAGAGGATIDALELDRVFHIVGGGLTISGVTIRNGDTCCNGGGIYLQNGSLSVSNTTLTDNESNNGGGAIKQDAGLSTLTNITVSGNRAEDGDGAGIAIDAGLFAIRNSTITANAANVDLDAGSNFGAGLSQDEFAPVPALGGIGNTIVAGNIEHFGGPTPGSNPSDCDGSIPSNGYNLIGDTTGCGFDTGDTGPGDLENVTAGLGPLADNGGPTPTHALLPGSPAIDAGNPGAPESSAVACLATDQRGLPRGGAAGRCDIGAFEVQPTPAIPPPAVSPPPRRKCKKGRKLVRRKGKLRCKKKKKRR